MGGCEIIDGQASRTIGWHSVLALAIKPSFSVRAFKPSAAKAELKASSYRSGEPVRHPKARADYLAITTVVQELRSLGKSRSAAMRILSRGRSPRMIGQ